MEVIITADKLIGRRGYEEILKLKEEVEISHPLVMRDLVNALYNLDNFTFSPELRTERNRYDGRYAGSYCRSA